MTETPTIRQELDRKLTDYMLNRESRMTTGDINPSVVGIEAGALWDVLSGLIDNDMAGMLAALEANAKRPAIKRFFVAAGSPGCLVLTYRPEKQGWLLRKMDGATNPVLAYDKAQIGPLREEKLGLLVRGLLAKNYTEIT